MAQVQPAVIDLLPDSTITLNVQQGIGASNGDSLAIHLEIASVATLTVRIKLTIRDPALYRFSGGVSTLSQDFQNVSNGSIVEFSLSIRNEVALTGAQLRLWVDANDIATPTIVLRDSSNNDVVYS